MPASKLVLKMLCSTDCLRQLLARNSRSRLNHEKTEAGIESLMITFAVPQCQSKSSRPGDSSHGHPSAQWLPDWSTVNEQSLRSSWEVKSAGPGWDQQDTGPSTASITSVQTGKEPRKGLECKCSSHGIGDKRSPSKAGKPCQSWPSVKQVKP